jgi:hypothetical protein
MDTEKKPRGRPKKKEGRVEAWQFFRAAIVISVYDQARQRGEKHSVAVREAIDYVRQNWTDLAISESEVRRILGGYRPRGSISVLLFQPSVLSVEDVKTNRWIRDQLKTLQGTKGITLPDIPDYSRSRNRIVLTIRERVRPQYPRHNRKTPKQ